jgi:hypothetical protein
LEDALSAYGSATANGPSSGEAEPSTAEQAKQKAHDTAQQAAGQAKGRVRDQVDQRSTDAGQRVSGMAQDARSVGDELRKQGKDQPARLADQAAERAEQLGDYLTRADGDTILRDIEDFGRRQPWAVIAGGLALGVAASRFLKASSDRRYHESSSRLPARREDVAPLAPTARTGLTGAQAGFGDTATGAGRPEPGNGGAGAGLPARDPRF